MRQGSTRPCSPTWCSGLIGVLRGDDSAVYFQMLAHDFKALELQRLKGQAQKIPPKIRVFSFVMLMCFLLTYMVIIALEIMKSLAGCSKKGGTQYDGKGNQKKAS